MEMEKEESLGRREKERSNEEVREKTIKNHLHSYNTYVYLHGYYSRVLLRSKIGHNEISPKTKEQVKPKRKISG